MGFEKFTAKSKPVRDKAMVSILKGGQFGINQVCYQKYFKVYKKVILYYDRERNTIGIKPTNEEAIEAYNIRLGRGGQLANISGVAFLKYYKIEHKESKPYMATWNNEEKLVEVDLNQ